MEPRYYSQVPFRGCSLMVKPQSSKLITRVRFPSSPRDLGSRRFRVEALSFSLEGMTGIPSACGFVSSRARNPHAPARHPLAQIPAKVAGNRLRAKIQSLARSGFSPSSPSSPPQIPLKVAGIRFIAHCPTAAKMQQRSIMPMHYSHAWTPTLGLRLSMTCMLVVRIMKLNAARHSGRFLKPGYRFNTSR